MAKRDVFMVFVDAKPGHEEDYARWFLREHLADMRNLPGVTSAFAGHLASLDGEPPPAQLCALYETPDGGELLKTIATSKGTPGLPVSDLQGAMVWRMLESVTSTSTGDAADMAGPTLICMCRDEIGESVLGGLQDGCEPILWARHMRISAIQPARGRDHAGFVLLGLEAQSDPADLAANLLTRFDAIAPRCLLVTVPQSSGVTAQ